jgi:hypothetical protein
MNNDQLTLSALLALVGTPASHDDDEHWRNNGVEVGEGQKHLNEAERTSGPRTKKFDAQEFPASEAFGST